MLEKFLNKKVSIFYTDYATIHSFHVNGIITNMDNEYVEIDNRLIISKKYIIAVEEK